MIAGVDGYKGGWVVVFGDGFPPSDLAIHTCKDFKGVLNLTGGCSAVMVDMPIGLPSGSDVRACDGEARKLLGKEASRVFLTPPRESLGASSPEEFQRTHRELRRSGAGLPVWGIVPKLKEVDEAMTPELQARVMEFHPELAWMRLAGSVLPSKHGVGGIISRLECLVSSKVFEKVVAISKTLPDSLKMDDFLDAYVGLKVAQDYLDDWGKRISEEPPPTDNKGLRMEIWY